MRKYLLLLMVVGVSLLYLGKLSYIQLVDDSYQLQSENIAKKAIYDYPERGYIYDRNGELLVANQPSYDVMIVPREVKNIDTTALCNVLKISKEDFIKRFNKATNHSWRAPSVFVSKLSVEDYSYLQEKLYRFKGFYIQKRALRKYLTDYGANYLGYIREVNQRNIKNDPYYNLGDLIGIQGVEEQYEKVLRGKKGIKYIQKDIHGRDIGPYKGGIYDTLPEQGKDLTLTISAKLQAYGQNLMVNKRGGIVAIEPKSGEILALITAPSYDPDLLVGRKRSKNFNKLYLDSINKPMYDRGLQAQYPPGSPFKIVNALIGLEENVIDEKTRFVCRHGFHYGGSKPMGCHCPYGKSNDLNSGIYESCNAYFGNTYKRIIDKYQTASKGIEVWSNHVKSFGLGDFLGYDLPIGRKGNVPDVKFYNKWYGENRWYSTFTISNAIGQGEVLTTPIQLANLTAAIANRGYYYKPHIVKEINHKPIKDSLYTTRFNTTISRAHFEPVIEGMYNVYEKGTARSARVKDIEICGKTGTAENFTKIDGKRVQLTDHSIFVAFAPKDDPKIAIAVFVENGYWGSRWAAPIASLMIEKHLKDEISRKDLETKVLNGSLMEEYLKPLSGEPFKINE